MTESILERDKAYNEQAAAIIKSLLQSSSNCIDVGAHKGDILKLFLECAPSGKHYAFEALPDFAKNLSAEFPMVTIYPYALSNVNGKTSFHYVSSNPGYSGIKKRSFDREHEDVELIEVEMRRLDGCLPGTAKIDFIKIDVEGAELRVLEGAEEILRKNHPAILFEHGKGAAEHYNTTPCGMYSFLTEKFGYKLFTLSGYLESSPPLSKADFTREFEEETNWNFVAV